MTKEPAFVTLPGPVAHNSTTRYNPTQTTNVPGCFVRRRTHSGRRPPAARLYLHSSPRSSIQSTHADDFSLTELLSPKMASEEGGYLYFCYGSNLSREKLRHRGGKDSPPIEYEQVWIGRLTGWQLCFDLRGAPPTEPCMGSIQQAPEDEVYGLVYRLRSEACWKKLLLSEGVTETPEKDSYHVIDVDVECYLADKPEDQNMMKVKTLMTNPRLRLLRSLQKDVRPSERYMKIMIDGATSEKLPKAYLERLKSIRVARKWQPSLLLWMMNFVIPLMFLTRRLRMRFITQPLGNLGVFLYAKHEGLVTEGKMNAAQKAQLMSLRFAMLFLYGVYAFPAMLLFLLSPRARAFKKQVSQVLLVPPKRDTPAESTSKPVQSSA